jgi:peroxiredoxin family protein
LPQEKKVNVGVCPSRMQLMKITKKQFVDDVVSIGRHFKGVQNDMKYLALQVVS